MLRQLVRSPTIKSSKLPTQSLLLPDVPIVTLKTVNCRYQTTAAATASASRHESNMAIPERPVSSKGHPHANIKHPQQHMAPRSISTTYVLVESCHLSHEVDKFTGVVIMTQPIRLKLGDILRHMVSCLPMLRATKSRRSDVRRIRKSYQL